MSAEKFAGCATQGKRDYQEDFYDFLPLDDGALLALLADGMGGHAGGAEAAQTAVGAFIEAFSHARKNDPSSRLSDEILHYANTAIAAKAIADASLAGMGCTLIAALIRADGMDWLSVGDSLLYMFAGGRLTKLNADHSIGGLLDAAVAAGRITAEEAADNPQRHFLRSALTGDKIELIDRGGIQFDATPPVIIAASDGLLTLSMSDIEACLNSFAGNTPDNIAAELVRQVDMRDTPRQDNASLLVIKPKPAQEANAT